MPDIPHCRQHKALNDACVYCVGKNKWHQPEIRRHRELYGRSTILPCDIHLCYTSRCNRCRRWLRFEESVSSEIEAFTVFQEKKNERQTLLASQRKQYEEILKEQRVSRKDFYARLKINFAELTVDRTIEEGYLYVIQNPAFDGWFKVGSTIKLAERLRTYQTSDPFRKYEYVWHHIVHDRRGAEEAVLKYAGRFDNITLSGEWINLPKQNVVGLCEKFVSVWADRSLRSYRS